MDLKGQHIVILSLFRFDAEIESTSFALARQLSKHNHVYYFDNPYTLNDVFRLRRTPALRRRRGLFPIFSDRSVKAGPGEPEIFIPPVVLSIHFLPEGWLYRLLLKFNESLIRQKIRYVLQKRGISRYIFINSFNFHYPGVSSLLKPTLRVYHCLDPILGAFDGRHGVVSEEKLVRESDLVVCSSRQLYLEKREVNSRTFFVPNAADLAHSSKALDAGLQVSPVLSGLPGPVVGYFGSVDHRMDLELLETTAKLLPDKYFVLFGPVFATIPPALKACANVIFAGRVAYSEMPSVIKGFDVAIIPFIRDKQSATVFPLKLFEYLGAGKPVVATDFNPDLQEFTGQMVQYCAGAAEFAEAIEAALQSDSEALCKARTALAAMHTWEHRAQQMGRILAGALAEGTQQGVSSVPSAPSGPP